MVTEENYRGLPCLSCGVTITVYSLSGLCRNCWNKNRHFKREHTNNKYDHIYYCTRCGRPQGYNGLCLPCKEGNESRLFKYRIYGGQAEHRYIYERRKNIELGDKIVHHLNGLKGDNRISNLLAIPRGLHDTKHLVTELKKRIRELEGLL